MRSAILAFSEILLIPSLLTFAQNVDTAKQVYDSSQESVFLVYLNNSSGITNALGSAFLVGPRILITNAHVVEAGSPVLAVGPVRIPLKVLRTDQRNDLAVLSVDVDLTSKPLPLASGTVSPGEQIFAIGNPEGLEKTISQGIISGLRKSDDRNLIQITSPISHGSSGGPVLNTKGEVVGVTVGMLDDGQNLNFAVPVEYVRQILEKKSDLASLFSLQASLEKARGLLSDRIQTQYSEDPSSDYQKNTQQLKEVMETIIVGTTDPSALIEVACLGTKAVELSDSGIKAARKLYRENPSADRHALLSYVLYDRAEDENAKSAFAKQDSPDQAAALATYKEFLSEAQNEANEAAKTAKGKSLLLADFVLGSTKNDEGEYATAISLHSLVVTGTPNVCGNDLTATVLRDLISESASAKRPDEAATWFKRYASLYQPEGYEWDSEGDRRFAAKDAAGAAYAYENAATKSESYSYDYCFAANEHSLQSKPDPDGVLADGRKCVEASVKQTEKENEHYFNDALPFVYQSMAEVLNDRGVYPAALEDIKESLSMKSDNSFALYTEARILANLEKNSECIAAAQAAVNASDGKYPSMHFQLGYCYFATENWAQAATSFRIAAEADNTDAVSAFDLGLSLSRQGFTADAEHWFRESLNRNPDDELRAKILSALK